MIASAESIFVWRLIFVISSLGTYVPYKSYLGPDVCYTHRLPKSFNWIATSLSSCFRWNFPTAPTCVGTSRGTRESSPMNVASVRSDSFARTIWRSTSQRTQRHYHITVRYVIAAFSGKLPCELISRTSMSDSMIWWRLVRCAVIVLERWNRCESTSLIAMASTWIILAQERLHRCFWLWSNQIQLIYCRRWRRPQTPAPTLSVIVETRHVPRIMLRRPCIFSRLTSRYRWQITMRIIRFDWRRAIRMDSTTTITRTHKLPSPQRPLQDWTSRQLFDP